MLANYSRTYFVSNRDFLPEEAALASVAASLSGLDWNYTIARHIDRDLHERLLSFDASLLSGFVIVLPLISSGYFYTAKTIVAAAAIDESLEETRTWLVSALAEADDTEATV